MDSVFLLSLFSGSHNYSIVNRSNLFNFLINIMQRQSLDEKNMTIECIRVNLGMTIYDYFKEYIRKKYEINNELNQVLK